MRGHGVRLSARYWTPAGMALNSIRYTSSDSTPSSFLISAPPPAAIATCSVWVMRYFALRAPRGWSSSSNRYPGRKKGAVPPPWATTCRASSSSARIFASRAPSSGVKKRPACWLISPMPVMETGALPETSSSGRA
ncbi:hypothetical protein BE20_32290 [Sorangium cellulosum]|nr:hypothetical protein BE20_32290 [Sorangium cellulosum]